VLNDHGLLIRRATTADAQGILACLEAAFSPYRDAYKSGAYEDTVLSPATIHERLDTATVYEATTASGEVVGTIGYILIDKEESHIRGMAVLPSWQGKGVAVELLRRVERGLRPTYVADLRSLNRTRMTLGTTKVLEQAERFYERHGFRRYGEVGDFFGMELFVVRVREGTSQKPRGRIDALHDHRALPGW
jgi:GNAT superfamily N-acetyltransferase